MAWLRLTYMDGSPYMINADKIRSIRTLGRHHPPSERHSLVGLCHAKAEYEILESVDEIAAMIADAERAERLDGIFKAIVYNFPQGYDPAEIVETARRLLDALDKPREE